MSPEPWPSCLQDWGWGRGSRRWESHPNSLLAASGGSSWLGNTESAAAVGWPQGLTRLRLGGLGGKESEPCPEQTRQPDSCPPRPPTRPPAHTSLSTCPHCTDQEVLAGVMRAGAHCSQRLPRGARVLQPWPGSAPSGACPFHPDCLGRGGSLEPPGLGRAERGGRWKEEMGEDGMIRKQPGAGRRRRGR